MIDEEQKKTGATQSSEPLAVQVAACIVSLCGWAARWDSSKRVNTSAPSEMSDWLLDLSISYLHQPSYAHHESAHSDLLVLYAQGGLVELSPDGGYAGRRRRLGQHWRSRHTNLGSALSSFHRGPGGAQHLGHTHSHDASVSHEAEESGLDACGAGKFIWQLGSDI